MNQQLETRAHRLVSDANHLNFLPIAVVNALLVIVTFNVYLFWAKSTVRRYLWASTRLQGTPLTYTGDGRKLAIGFLLTAASFLLLLGYPLVVVINALDIDPAALEFPDVGLLGTLLLAVLIPAYLSVIGFLIAITPAVTVPAPITAGSFVALLIGVVLFVAASRFLTYRYLFSHTLWRGTTGTISGSPWRYAIRMLRPELSVLITFGWTVPWRFARRFEPILNGATFAGRMLSFRPELATLYRPFAVAWFAVAGGVGALVALAALLQPVSPLLSGVGAIALAALGFGIIVAAAAYYNARLFAHVARSVSLDEVTFRFTASTRALTALYLTNLLMNLLSVGLSYYFSRLRIARFMTRHLQVVGVIEPARPAAEQPGHQPFGEGLEVLVAGSYL